MPRDAMARVLLSSKKLEKTGVRIKLPGMDGKYHTRRVLMTMATAADDNSEKNRVFAAKDGHKQLWMLCSMHGGCA